MLDLVVPNLKLPSTTVHRSATLTPMPSLSATLPPVPPVPSTPFNLAPQAHATVAHHLLYYYLFLQVSAVKGSCKCSVRHTQSLSASEWTGS